MWMEGTGSYAKLDTKGDESGYQLTTWGGTVGMDVDLSDHFTMGAAFTANYGDLTASAADLRTATWTATTPTSSGATRASAGRTH